MTSARANVFYGWWVALIAALGLFWNTATIIVFPFGVFAKAMGQEFHSGRAKISLAFTIHNLTAALCVPLAGRVVDHYGPQRVLLHQLEAYLQGSRQLTFVSRALIRAKPYPVWF